MIKNNIKTVLFASLIVAMILPFSSMNMAEAEIEIRNEQNQEDIRLLNEVKDRYQEYLSTSENPEETLKAIERLDIVLQLIELPETSNTYADPEMYSEKMASILIERLDMLTMSEDLGNSESGTIETFTKKSVLKTLTHTDKIIKRDCDLKKSINGTIDTSVIIYNVGSPKLTVDYEMPEEWNKSERDRRTVSCNAYEFDHAESKLYVLADSIPTGNPIHAATCTLTIDDADSNKSKTCRHLSAGKLSVFIHWNTYDSDRSSINITTTPWLVVT